MPDLKRVYVIVRNYRVVSRLLEDDGVYWRSWPYQHVYLDENVFEEEIEALREAHTRARLRRDTLNDIVERLAGQVGTLTRIEMTKESSDESESHHRLVQVPAMQSA